MVLYSRNGKSQRIQKVGGTTKAEAQDALKAAIKDYETGGTVILTDTSISDYFDFWFENYVEKRLKYNTQKKL